MVKLEIGEIGSVVEESTPERRRRSRDIFSILPEKVIVIVV